jgi:hypothetical protein
VTLLWGVGALAVEAVGMAVGLAILLYADIAGQAGSVRGAVTVTVFAALLAAAFGGLAHSLWRRRRWARGPAIVLQLLLVPIGWGVVGGLGWPGYVVMALGLVGAGALLAPTTRTALG